MIKIKIIIITTLQDHPWSHKMAKAIPVLFFKHTYVHPLKVEWKRWVF